MNTELVRQALEGQYAAPSLPSERDQIIDEFLTPRAQLGRKWHNILQPRIALDAAALAPHVAEEPPYDPRVHVHFDRTGLDGRITSMRLQPSQLSQDGAMAMTRKISARAAKDVKGKSGQMPFTPGGLDINEQSAATELHRGADGLLDIAPGLSRTLQFNDNSAVDDQFDARNLIGKADGDDALMETGTEIDPVMDEISERVSMVDLDDGESVADSEAGDSAADTLPQSKFNDIDSLLPPTASFVRNIVEAAEPQAPEERKWAHMVDINQEIPNFNELVPNPARTWPFELDNFQKEAVYRLEQGDSVFIAAHTSAGKTVVAEYAMSMAANHMTKCIYTSPIKALSNQKYRDFKEEYEDVGILTGDVQLNPEASTLIMTTEILRSMLYRGADIIRDVEFIIFDEVHYVNDNERGVVWEEVIIMLPDHVKLVLLSATVPNTFEFANWVGRTKQKDVYVISTPKRPVPLKHHLWVKKKVYEIVNEDRKFEENNYRAAREALEAPKKDDKKDDKSGAARGGRGGARGGARGGPGGARGGGAAGKQAMQRQLGPSQARFNSSPSSKNELLDLVEHLRTNKLLPAVFFVFSRKLAETFATHLQSVSLNTAREKSQVYMFMDSAVARLRKEDRKLPQIEMLRQLLQQGIGLHHSGLLPIMKEVVEMLFAKGLVKLLFATETFAMGLNLPTRTVVFTSVRKFDSQQMRYLTPGEYTQMAGRAGRRGLDPVGTVIIMIAKNDGIIPRNHLEQMVLGTPLKLSSQFRLTYNMILSLLRIEAVRVEDVIQQSFSENAQFTIRPDRERRLLQLERINKDATDAFAKTLATLKISDGSLAAFEEFVPQMMQLGTERRKFFDQISWVLRHRYGQIALVRNKAKGSLDVHLLIGALEEGASEIKTEGLKLRSIQVGTVTGPHVSLPYAYRMQPTELITKWTLTTNSAKHLVVDSSDIELVSQLRQARRLPPPELAEYLRNNWSLLFTDIDRNIFKRIESHQQYSRVTKVEQNVIKLAPAMFEATDSLGPAKSKTVLDELMMKTTRQIEIAKIRESAALSNTALLPDYEQRIRVLQDGGYLDDSLNVALKGRVACEISTGFELYLTELIMDNFLGSYEPEEIVALLSAFVFDGARGAEDSVGITPKLDRGRERLLELVDNVQELAVKHQVTLMQNEAEFAEKNRFALMQVVYEWARGMTFSEIMTLTPLQEGLIVRVINRLDEICRSVMNAARIIGAVDLYDKVAIAQERIRRDIVFCSSLYL